MSVTIRDDVALQKLLPPPSGLLGVKVWAQLEDDVSVTEAGDSDVM